MCRPFFISDVWMAASVRSGTVVPSHPPTPSQEFLDETTCGPPASLSVPGYGFSWTLEGDEDDSEDCASTQAYNGTCQVLGSSNVTYNPVYACDCADVTLVDRTPAPTHLVTLVTLSPSMPPARTIPSSLFASAADKPSTILVMNPISSSEVPSPIVESSSSKRAASHTSGWKISTGHHEVACMLAGAVPLLFL